MQCFAGFLVEKLVENVCYMHFEKQKHKGKFE